MKDTNPKTAFGLKKPDLFYVPFRALFWQGLAHLQGALKYGPFNWRKDPVSASTYLNAAIRHLNEWREGVERDKDSGVHPLAHVAACCNILIDAQACGMLVDDRGDSPAGDMNDFYTELAGIANNIRTEWGPKDAD